MVNLIIVFIKCGIINQFEGHQLPSFGILLHQISLCSRLNDNINTLTYFFFYFILLKYLFINSSIINQKLNFHLIIFLVNQENNSTTKWNLNDTLNDISKSNIFLFVVDLCIDILDGLVSSFSETSP